MRILRTPLSHFEDLPGFSFQANYINVGPVLIVDENNESHSFDTLNMHYIDYGPKDAPVVLMLHGEPSWSYLYRDMITLAEMQGLRVIAPDLIGFGKSDKFNKQSAYTYASHLAWLQSFIDKLQIKEFHLFCQDWGGLLGLRLVADQPERFKSVIAANTMLPTGEHKPPEAFFAWQKYSQNAEDFDIGNILQQATQSNLIEETVDAYNAPFPDESYKAAARKFPMLVPTSTDDPESQNNIEAWKVLRRFRKPFLTLFSDSDPVTKGGEKIFQKLVPGCANQAHKIMKNGGHFLQEDCAEELIREIVVFIKRQYNG